MSFAHLAFNPQWKNNCSTLGVAVTCLWLAAVASSQTQRPNAALKQAHLFSLSRSSSVWQFSLGQTEVKVSLIKAVLDYRRPLCAHAARVGLQCLGRPSQSGGSPWQHRINVPPHQASRWPGRSITLETSVCSAKKPGGIEEAETSLVTIKWKQSTASFRHIICPKMAACEPLHHLSRTNIAVKTSY